MSRPCGLWQRKLPFAAGMGSASTTPVLRWWSSSQVGGSSAASAAVAAANGRPWHPPAQSGAVGCCRPVRDRWRRSQRRVELQFKKVKLVYRTARAPSLGGSKSVGSRHVPPRAAMASAASGGSLGPSRGKMVQDVKALLDFAASVNVEIYILVSLGRI